MSWGLTESAMTMIDVREVRGTKDNPLIVGMSRMFANWVADDETAWCGSFAGFICKVNGYPTPGPEPWRALQARRWITVGNPVDIEKATNNCLVIFKKGKGKQPEADVLDAPGHVAFYVSHDDKYVTVVGGNQGNRVSIAKYAYSNVLGIRKMRRV